MDSNDRKPPKKVYKYGGGGRGKTQYYYWRNKEINRELAEQAPLVMQDAIREAARQKLLDMLQNPNYFPRSSATLPFPHASTNENSSCSNSKGDTVFSQIFDSPDEQGEIESNTHDVYATNNNIADSSEDDCFPVITECLPPVQVVHPLKIPDAQKEARRELHAIFALNNATVALQKSILKFIKKKPFPILKSLPIDHRPLRPPPIEFHRYPLQPGEMIYFGIQKVLSFPEVNLFDFSGNTVRLSLNVDGVPLFRDPKGVGFWPILGSVDNYPVFLIGLYSGVSKLKCPNAYLRPLIEEVKNLEEKGLLVSRNSDSLLGTSASSVSDNCEVRVFTFRVHNFIMDAPALSYVTCIKGHNSRVPCPKCKVIGVTVKLHCLGLNKRGLPKKGIRYFDMDAASRTNEEFRVYLKYTLLENNQDPTTGQFDCCEHYLGVRQYFEGDDDISSLPASEDEDDDDLLGSDYDDDDNENQLAENPVYLDALKTHYHDDHASILCTLHHFDIIRDVPLDYMHLICIGVMKRLLEYWTSFSQYRMSNMQLNVVSTRLEQAKQFFPFEFQRKCEKLDHLTNYKATQFRSFLLYIGPVVLRDQLRKEYLNHFYLLAFTMRLLIARVDNASGAVHQETITARGKTAKFLLRHFVSRAPELYTSRISTLKMHEIVHIVDDYLRFGPLDNFSAFRFESFLSKLKKMVHAHRFPAMQVVNNYSALLHVGKFAKQGNRGIDALHEYFEEPILHYKYKDSDRLVPNFFKCGRSADAHNEYTCYKKLCVSSFCIRVDNEADCYCVVVDRVSCKITYMKVCEILHDRQQNRIYLCGNIFKIHAAPLYSVEAYDSTGQLVRHTSKLVGSLCGTLTRQPIVCSFEDLTHKVFALPLAYNEDGSPLRDEYALHCILHW